MTTRNLPDWIEAYLVYTSESESPTDFHLWSAATALAGALERKVWFDMGYFLLYPNLYVVLVSPPGRCKKSTAMRIGRSMLAGVMGINFTTDSISRERLIQDLSQAHKEGQSAMTSYASEFGTLLTTSGMDMVVFLTDIYDSPSEWAHKTKAGGTNKIKAPYLNLEAGTTPDYMAKALPFDTVGIGLTSRIIFVYQDVPRIKDPFPELSPDQIRLKDLLIEDLRQINMISGQFTLDDDAKQFYREWYVERGNESLEADPRLSGYLERKPMHLLKLSMVISSSTSNDCVIKLKTLQRALRMLEMTEHGMPQVFAGVGRNPLNADIESMIAALLHNPEGVPRDVLMEKFRHNVRREELAEILETLMESGYVVLRNGRYIATDKAKSRVKPQSDEKLQP